MLLIMFVFSFLFPDESTPLVPEKERLEIGYTKIQWSDLARIQFKNKYNDEFQMEMPYPIFHETVKELDGKKVMIAGYVIPLDESPENPITVLSANPYSTCFFCGAAGPETVMDIKPENDLGRLDMDRRITFRGTLQLNEDDLYSLYYILHDAEIVN